MTSGNEAIVEFFANDMIVDFDVFSTFIKDMVFCYVDGSLVSQ